MMWYLLCLLAGRCSCSSSSVLDGAVLEMCLPAGALPFLRVEVSGMRSSLELEPAGKLGRIEDGALLVIVNRIYHSHHQMRNELLQLHQPSQRGWQKVVVEWQPRSWLVVWPRVGRWRMCRGTASSDWAGGGDEGGVGAKPNGESGVDYLLAGMGAGVVVGLVVEVWLGTGMTCGVAARGEWAAAGADGPASLGATAGEWAGLVGGVGIATLMGVASAMSILRMYSFFDHPAFSVVYLSPSWVGTTAGLHRSDMMHGKAKMPMSFLHAAASS
ncbi:hypothetical protein V6N13_052200 [Hibiscus sabdariffa]